jgi:excisionase family DNA binding protein
MSIAIPFRERISCTIAEACEATGIGRTKLYQGISAGRVQTSKVGTRVLILVQSLESLVQRNASSGASGWPAV